MSCVLGLGSQGLRAESGPFFQSDFTAQSAKLMIHMCAIKTMGLRVACWVLTADCVFLVTITISGSNSRVPASRCPSQNRAKNCSSLGTSKVLQAGKLRWHLYFQLFQRLQLPLRRIAEDRRRPIRVTKGHCPPKRVREKTSCVSIPNPQRESISNSFALGRCGFGVKGPCTRGMISLHLSGSSEPGARTLPRLPPQRNPGNMSTAHL